MNKLEPKYLMQSQKRVADISGVRNSFLWNPFLNPLQDFRSANTGFYREENWLFSRRYV